MLRLPKTPTTETAPSLQPNNERYLIFGSKGWIAGILIDQLKAAGKEVRGTPIRLEDRAAIMNELDTFQPTLVFNCAGVTGRPNVDWCEDNKEATIRSNMVGTLNLADCCFLRGIHMTNYATGCIYQYDEKHQWHGVGFTEEDEPNFAGSFYSYTKALTEKAIRTYSNVLTLRLRMPVSDDLSPRNFVTKITRYEKVVDIPNSNSILHDLLPASIAMAENRVTGVYNFTNPGAISHNEILEMYKQWIDPAFTWKNFSLEEQSKVIKAGRSNCELDTTKLVSTLQDLGITIPEIHEAYQQCFQRMARNLKGQSHHEGEEELNNAISHDCGRRVFEERQSPKTILVTGGAGFIASYVVRKLVLLYPEYNIVNLDKIDYCSSLNNTKTLKGRHNYSFVKADITNRDRVLSILREKSVDVILHFAAQSHVDNSFGNSADFTHNNVMGTHVLLEAAREYKISRFIHVSTDEVYGEVEHGSDDLPEESILAPTNPYAATKAAAEMLVHAYHKSFGLPTIITRSNNVYGPYQFPEKIIPKFINLLNEGKKCCIHGDGSNTRRYIYATDVADAIDIVLHQGHVGETYNIGTTLELSNLQLAHRLIRLMGLPGQVEDHLEFVPDRPFNDRRYAVDSQKLQKMGWSAKVEFDEGLKKTIAWYTQYGRYWWGNIESLRILAPHPTKAAALAVQSAHLKKLKSEAIANDAALAAAKATPASIEADVLPAVAAMAVV
ncbi:hypothetical protein HK104_003996 [Borealophlyctis nickersoniae]|nr:hypothetical protein HK104_003996 [Borealophlyctis nickersoniae]